MKVFIYMMLFSGSFLWALDGYEVYKRYCSSCHMESVSPEKLASIRKVVKSGGKPPISAPLWTKSLQG